MTTSRRDVGPPILRSLVPQLAQWEWQGAAACRGMDPAAFFHPTSERSRARQARIDHAKAICQDCPVIQQCLAHALAMPEPYGIWGGLSEDERARLLGIRLGSMAKVPAGSRRLAKSGGRRRPETVKEATRVVDRPAGAGLPLRDRVRANSSS